MTMIVVQFTDDFKRSLSVPLTWKPNTTACDVRRILQAAADGDYLAADFKVPNNMGCMIASDGEQCPVIDHGMLEGVGDKLLKGQFSKWFPDEVGLKGLSSEGWTTFESNAFRTLALFLLFFYHNREATHPLPTGKQTARLTNWVPESVNKVKIRTLKKGIHERYSSQPFTSRNYTELSEDFQTALEALKVGDTILLHCDGSAAPLDFILVTLEKDKTLHIRYADAKHRSNEVMSKREVDEMLDKAKGVHNKLRELLKGQFTVPVWKASNFLLITNSELKGARVMSPLTTKWEPMTKVLYRSVPALPAPTSSVLASRPVYPVLSQLPEMTRKTWSTPPPQTGARLTRTVPVLWFVRRLKFM